MASSNPSQLFLLADHIKLSLLERQRAISLNLPQNAQDGQISRSLESLESGIEAAERSLEDSPNADLSLQLTRLRQQYTDLSSQFHGHTTPSSTTIHPNNPALSRDFSAAQSKRTPHSSLRRNPSNNPANKSVRFRDSSPDAANRTALFPYRDDPNAEADLEAGPDPSTLDNHQIHEYHRDVLAQQDEQLDRLGESIGRQRELSMAIGDELDGQVLLLDEVDEGVDRHQSGLDRARKRLDKVGRRARENWSMTVIIVLIVILVLLIVITR